MVLLRKDEVGESTAQRTTIAIALARCPGCRRRWRVLPCDVLPRKRFSVPVIASHIRVYVGGEKSLREVAWNHVFGDTPSHNALHGWTEGLGDYLKGSRRAKIPGSTPASRLLEETRRRHPDVTTVESRRVRVSPVRYRTKERRLRLKALAVFTAMLELVGQMELWVRSIPRWRSGDSFDFPAVISSTPIEHGDRRRRRGFRGELEQEKRRCGIRGRSPPGDTS